MLRRCLGVLLALALLGSSGAPAAVLQLAAWGRMAATFLRHDDLSVSLRKTFDGRHPCAICLAVRRASPAASLAERPESRPPAALPSLPAPVFAGFVRRVPPRAPSFAGRAAPPPLSRPPKAAA